MVIGLLTVDIRFPGKGSLKEKRFLLRRITEKLKQHFNISVAEVDYQDLWQRTCLAIACVNTSTQGANATLDRALNLLHAFHEIQILDQHLEMR